MSNTSVLNSKLPAEVMLRTMLQELYQEMQKRRNMGELPLDGLLSIKEVLQFLPVKKSSWWQGVKDGIYPQPVRLGTRTVAWRAQDIRKLIDQGVEGLN